MDEFVGKRVRVEFVQEPGWKRPTRLYFDNAWHEVKEVVSRWEGHEFHDPWWTRKHRVWYEVALDDGFRYHLYWDRGPKGQGKDWILVKRVS